MLRLTALIAMTLLPLAPAAASPAAAPKVAERDGYKFQYVTQLQGGGRIQIQGRMLDGKREPFSLTVERDGRVRGDIGDARVEYSVARQKVDKLASALQARETQVAQSTPQDGFGAE